MDLLYPKIRLAWLPAMLAYAGAGAIVAGLYGVVHDQVTYSISSEYFTKLKFQQFHYADFGWPPRGFVAEIGFLATWWVGFFAAWFLARVTVPAFSPPVAFRHTRRGFVIVFICALGAAVIGFFFGWFADAGRVDSAWTDVAVSLEIADMPNFVRVAYIHNASYLGGLIGLIAALLYVRRMKAIVLRPTVEQG